MILPIGVQARLVFFCLLAGVITGGLFDLYRIMRGFKNPNKVVTFIEDTLFWIFTAIVVFIFLVFTKSTHLGMYAYMFIAIGLIIYMVFISKIFLIIQYRIFNSIGKASRIFMNIILYPLKIVFYKVKFKNKKKIIKK